MSAPTGSSAWGGAVCSSHCSASSTSPTCRLASTSHHRSPARSRVIPSLLQHRQDRQQVAQGLVTLLDLQAYR